jgi:hypothetical protein
MSYPTYCETSNCFCKSWVSHIASYYAGGIFGLVLAVRVFRIRTSGLTTIRLYSIRSTSGGQCGEVDGLCGERVWQRDVTFFVAASPMMRCSR